MFKNFYGGGLGSVRVFEAGSLGPVDPTGSYIGGNRRFNTNAELYLPVPGSGNDKTLRLFGFMDAGNVWGENEKIKADSIRASIGIGLSACDIGTSWILPRLIGASRANEIILTGREVDADETGVATSMNAIARTIGSSIAAAGVGSRRPSIHAWARAAVCRRSLDEASPSASRYFATVRLATLTPSSASIAASCASLSGFSGSSSATSLRMRARMATDETSSPSAPETWLEKKYLNSKMPRGVCMYLPVVTREMVDSCIATASATSRRIMGCIASSPRSRTFAPTVESESHGGGRSWISLSLSRSTDWRASCPNTEQPSPSPP